MDESSKNYPNKVGAAHAVIIKTTKPLNKCKREPEEDDLETKVILKKQKKHKEQSKKKKKKKKGKKSSAMKTHVKAAPNSQRSSDNSSSDDEADPTKKRAETAKYDGSVQTKAESSSSEVQAIYTCCFDTEDAEGNNEKTIFVKGFDSSLPRDDIKSALTKHFGPCGEITRVFVPIQCNTGVSLGFAFINLKEDPKKALKLNKSDMGGWKLKVKRAIRRDEYYGFLGFSGCKRCRLRSLLNSHYRGFLGPCCEAMFYR